MRLTAFRKSSWYLKYGHVHLQGANALSSWNQLLTEASLGGHLVQLYGKDDLCLAKNVGRFLSEGMRQLDGLLVIATPTHTQAISRHLAEEAASAALAAERDGRLVFLDARETLDRLLVEGQPDKYRFESVVGRVLSEVLSRSRSGKVRAFGEMVSLLWADGHQEQARVLESLWNEHLAGSRCSLYCAYSIDLFGDGVDPAGLSAIVGAHSHLLAGHNTVLSSVSAGSR
jgi:hypothetical protein